MCACDYINFFSSLCRPFWDYVVIGYLKSDLTRNPGFRYPNHHCSTLLYIISYFLNQFILFQVSWVRNVDAHMLFIGRDRFVHDDRYELIPSRHGRWTLKLKYVTARDAGRFECQVSTVPKLNQTFSLKVVGKYKDIGFLNK